MHGWVFYNGHIVRLYTVFIVSLASITSASLSLEELNLKVQQLEQNDVSIILNILQRALFTYKSFKHYETNKIIMQ